MVVTVILVRFLLISQKAMVHYGHLKKTIVRGDLPLYEADSYSYGGTVNFDKIMDRTGSFTISNTKDKQSW